MNSNKNISEDEVIKKLYEINDSELSKGKIWDDGDYETSPYKGYEVFQREKGNLIWWVNYFDDDKREIGEFLFSFDRKTVFNFWTDYPDKLTPEQIKIFQKENPTLAALKPTK